MSESTKTAASSNAAVPTSTRRLSLRTRWTLAFVVAGAVPLGLLGAATLKIQRDGLVKSEQVHEFAVIDHVTEVIEGALREAQGATHRAGLVLTDPRITDEDAKLTLAREMLASAPSVAQIAIYLPDGTYVDAINRGTESEGMAPAAPRRVPASPSISATGEGGWLATEQSASGPLLRFLEPVRRDNELRAWVLATLRPRHFDERLRGISLDRFDNRADGLLILDEEGKVLATSIRSVARESLSTLTVGQSMLGRDLLAGTNVTAGTFGSDTAVSREFVSTQGEPMVGTLRTLPTHRWAIVARRPASAVFTSLALARRSLVGASMLFLVVAVLISAVLASRTVRPIQALMRLARAYGQRKFEARSEVNTGDELELLGGQMTSMADDIVKSEKEILRRAKVESNLSRFIPASVAKSVAEGERELALGGERRLVTVLFADVASFTPFVEATDPERVVAFLNELFGVMTEVVFRYDGTVDKFIGDSVMAVFGAPTDLPDHVERAVSCAEDMHRFVESTGERWKERYGIAPKLAIGISTGEALVGNLGSETRMEYTAVGDTVNVAARLEALARPGQTLVTNEVKMGAEAAFEFAPMGEQQLRGKSQAISLYELVR